MHKSKVFHFMNNNKKCTHVISHPDQEIEHDLGRMEMRVRTGVENWSFLSVHLASNSNHLNVLLHFQKKALKYGKTNLKM